MAASSSNTKIVSMPCTVKLSSSTKENVHEVPPKDIKKEDVDDHLHSTIRMATSSSNTKIVSMPCTFKLSSSTKENVHEVPPKDIKKEDVDDHVITAAKLLKELDDELEEVVMVSDSADKKYCCFVYDIKTGERMTAFEGGHSIPKGLDCIRSDYLIASIEGEDILRVWGLSKNAERIIDMKAPAYVSALAASSITDFCLVAVGATVYVWEVNNGCLLNKWTSNTSRITCMKFLVGESHFFVGCEEGNVLVFALSAAVNELSTPGDVKPQHIWTHHNAPVTDIHAGYVSDFGRVLTAALDFTCRIYELRSGKLLLTLKTEFLTSAIIADSGDQEMYLGSTHGDIYKVCLYAAVEKHTDDVEHKDLQINPKFEGHTADITCLSISSTGTYLASGSVDKTCRIWNTHEHQCILKLPHAGPITNVIIRLPGPFLHDDFDPDGSVSRFRFNMREGGGVLYCKIGQNQPLESSRLKAAFKGELNEFHCEEVIDIETALITLQKTREEIEEDERKKREAEIEEEKQYNYAANINTQLASFGLAFPEG